MYLKTSRGKGANDCDSNFQSYPKGEIAGSILSHDSNVGVLQFVSATLLSSSSCGIPAFSVFENCIVLRY
jgi:hypothetical protein